MTRWKCNKCPYVYDPRVGDPDGGIPPGTPFERIPNDWICPVCGASKRDFRPLAAQPSPAAIEKKVAVQPEPQPAPSPVVDRPPFALTVGSLRGRPQR